MATNNSCDYSPTQYNVQVGGANGTLSNVSPSATSGVPVISQGSSANPVFGTAVVAGGGTGAVTFTANGVLLGNTTSAITATTAGTTGQVLTGVTGSAPTFQSPAASSISITGDSGGALTGASFTFTGGTTGLTFAGSGSTETLGGTLVVANGGTGDTSLTAYAVLTGGTTSTGAVQSIASVGTSGQVLTSNGAGALPTFQASSGGGITTATVTLTSAQVKALHATPITVLSAPGSGKFISIIHATSQLNYGGTNAFVNGGGQAIQLYLGTDSTGVAQIIGGMCTSAMIIATSSQVLDIYGGFSGALGAQASSTVLNKALVASQSSATEITGNAAGNNTISITVWYSTITP